MFEVAFCAQKATEFCKLTKTSPKFSETFHRERFLVTSSKEVTEEVCADKSVKEILCRQKVTRDFAHQR